MLLHSKCSSSIYLAHNTICCSFQFSMSNIPLLFISFVYCIRLTGEVASLSGKQVLYHVGHENHIRYTFANIIIIVFLVKKSVVDSVFFCHFSQVLPICCIQRIFSADSWLSWEKEVSPANLCICS